MSRPYMPARQIFTNQSMTSTVSSAPVNIDQLSLVGFDVAWTGTPTGTFSIEVSNSYSLNPNGSLHSAGLWTALTLSNSVAPAGSASNGFIDIDAISASWIRLTYTATSGTGTLNAFLSAKVS